MQYGNGTWLAIQSLSAISSTDNGATWTFNTLPNAAAAWYFVAFGAGLFVAIGYTTATYITSSDGVSWTTRTLPHATRLLPVDFVNGQFVCFGKTGSTNYTMFSADGISWTASESSFASNTPSSYRIAYKNSQYVMSTENLQYSSDLLAFTAVTPAPTITTPGLAVFNDRFILCGGDFSSFQDTTRSIIAYSSDGVAWTSLPALPSPSGDNNFAHSGNPWYVLVDGGICTLSGCLYDVRPGRNQGSGGAWKLATKNGTDWSALAMPASFVSSFGMAGNGRFIDIGSDSSGSCCYVHTITDA
jgi:hypothetical protein